MADFHARDGRLVEAARPYLRGEVKLADEIALSLQQKPVVADVDWQNIDYAPRGEKFYLGPPLRALKQ